MNPYAGTDANQMAKILAEMSSADAKIAAANWMTNVFPHVMGFYRGMGLKKVFELRAELMRAQGKNPDA